VTAVAVAAARASCINGEEGTVEALEEEELLLFFFCALSKERSPSHLQHMLLFFMSLFGFSSPQY
jgi:hypothetical protein